MKDVCDSNDYIEITIQVLLFSFRITLYGFLIFIIIKLFELSTWITDMYNNFPDKLSVWVEKAVDLFLDYIFKVPRMLWDFIWKVFFKIFDPIFSPLKTAFNSVMGQVKNL